MILEKVVIENFRQYFGRQEIVFATGTKKNVTVVHAENGFGKTALLNALLWGFYGFSGLTEDFELPEKIINEWVVENALDPNKAEAVVKIFFKHGRESYTLKRSLTLAQQNDDPKKTAMALEITLADGQTINEARPQLKLQSILPDGISPFLFFNGERIDQLSRATNSSKVTEAIHQMLGLKLLETTISDLKGKVTDSFSSELKQYADEDTKKLIEDAGEVAENIKHNEERVNTLHAEIEAGERLAKDFRQKLQDNVKTKDLQKRREELQNIHTQLNQELDDNTKEAEKLISEKAFVIFTNELVETGKTILGKLRSEGKVPAGVSKDYIENLLQNKVCICGTGLKNGSKERQSVEKILMSYCNNEFNEAISSIDKAIGSLDSLRPEIISSLSGLTKKRSDLQKQLVGIQEDIAEICKNLQDKDDLEITAWEQGLTKISLNRREKDQEIGELKNKASDLNSRLEALKTKIRDSKLKEEKAAIVQKRMNAVEDVISTLSNILEIETQELRSILNDEIKSHFERIILKNFFAEIDENFTLRIRKRIIEDGEAIDVAKSMGENQITSLVFIASLVHIAQKRDEIPSILKGLQGGEYPVCMDSPFGQLGQFYRGEIAQLIPDLAPQVLVFVSPSQWEGSVEDNMKNKVGKHYLLVYNGDQPPEKISHQVKVLGRSFQHFKHDSFEHTTIVELENL